MQRDRPVTGKPPWARYGPGIDSSPHLPSGWWLLPFGGLGLCLWTGLAFCLARGSGQ